MTGREREGQDTQDHEKHQRSTERDGSRGRFRFRRTRGCAVYPEAELNAHGTPWRGKTSYGTVGGYLPNFGYPYVSCLVFRQRDRD